MPSGYQHVENARAHVLINKRSGVKNITCSITENGSGTNGKDDIIGEQSEDVVWIVSCPMEREFCL